MKSWKKWPKLKWISMDTVHMGHAKIAIQLQLGLKFFRSADYNRFLLCFGKEDTDKYPHYN